MFPFVFRFYQDVLLSLKINFAQDSCGQNVGFFMLHYGNFNTETIDAQSCSRFNIRWILATLVFLQMFMSVQMFVLKKIGGDFDNF
jgi:hypothetical protein